MEYGSQEVSCPLSLSLIVIVRAVQCSHGKYIYHHRGFAWYVPHMLRQTFSYQRLKLLTRRMVQESSRDGSFRIFFLLYIKF